MYISTATFYLASVMATFVVLTTSFPQSPSSPSDGIPRRKPVPNGPFDYQPPNGCPGVGAIKYQTDVELKFMKRDSRSPETHAAALDPRMPDDLPCGIVGSGGQSDTFRFTTSRPVWLLWTFGGAAIKSQVVRIMQVNPRGRDIVAAVALARDFNIGIWEPLTGAQYYVQVSRGPHFEMTWFFDWQE